jgi:uncharacterized protein
MAGLGLQPSGFRPVTRMALLLAVLAPLAPVFAQPQTPELTGPVNDFARVIDPASAAEIERQILALKAASGDVVIVATIDTFEPYADIREYAVRLFENRGRGIGDRGKDNGLLLLLAVKNRRVRVEVGYDLEQFVTDGFAGDVSRTVMAPRFDRGEYGPGLLEGVNRLIARIAQGRGVTLEGVPVPQAEPIARIPISPGLIIALIIIMIVLSNVGPRSRMRPRRRWGAGPWSGWNSGVGPFGGGGGFGGGGFGGCFGGFGGGRSGGGGGGAGW